LYDVAPSLNRQSMVELLAALEAQNPKCKYLDEGLRQLFVCDLSQSGGSAKIPGSPRRPWLISPTTPICCSSGQLHMAAKQSDRAQRTPTGWWRRRARNPSPKAFPRRIGRSRRPLQVGSGYWVSGGCRRKEPVCGGGQESAGGVALHQRQQRHDGAGAVFYLGLANYNLGKMTMNKAKILEGAKFSDECAAIPGDTAEQAWKEFDALMKAEAAKMR
jgi:hypothetical protein